MKGNIFDIQRFSLHDGPGIRTTVFLKGCNMRCKWCHNPESFTTTSQIKIDFSKCIGCGRCANVCPNGCHQLGEKHDFLVENCSFCSNCIEACPVDAISIVGKMSTADEVMETVVKDEAYYLKSGGGVTFSGGEASMQSEFLIELAKKCKEKSYHTALETNGLVSEANMIKICDFIDLFLFDYKLTNEEDHIGWTGVSNKNILKNFELLNKLNKDVVLRCPIIPGVNDNDEHFEGIKAIKNKYSNIINVEIMPYHDLGAQKWGEIGTKYSLADVKNPSPETVKVWREKVL